ncbi:MAG: DUF1501 domain-containing protein [Bryobacteraceae bacterium]
MQSRRNFLRSCRTLAAAGAGAQLMNLGQMSALAQSAPNYKALVCIFLFGGNDANNMIIPLDATRYQAYQRMRPNIALPSATLLPVAAGGGQTPYGLHPRLVNLQRLYNQQKAAMVFNVGTLVTPTTKAMLNSTTLPRNLYSHSDQTVQWQTSNPLSPGGPGWGGRIADLLTGINASTFPMGVSVQGSAAFLQGVTSRPINLAPGTPLGLERFGDGNAMNAREAGLQQLLTFDTGMQMIGAASGVMVNAIKGAQEINAALSGGAPLTTPFPQTNLGSQLHQVATVMRVRETLGMNRQIYFCGLGGFDTHSDQLPQHDNLMGQLDAALGAFYKSLERDLRLANEVTTFTESEFGRTGNPSSSNGSDHAWGSHHFVMGASVRGGEGYGTFPTLALQGPDDASNRGLWIPTTGLDQFAATMGAWFGLGSGDLNTIFPNLANFPSPNIGFMR